ncbi:MAG: hypothetical protein J6V24_03835 [Clostridia bacterium]|nr:hypothetical protein [Clostridia bacterium]
MERRTYRFVFRTDGGEMVQIKQECHPGYLDEEARLLCRRVADKLGSPEVRCVWRGEIREKIPPRLIREAAAL